jgi:hypothetical protein
LTLAVTSSRIKKEFQSSIPLLKNGKKGNGQSSFMLMDDEYSEGTVPWEHGNNAAEPIFVPFRNTSSSKLFVFVFLHLITTRESSQLSGEAMQ